MKRILIFLLIVMLTVAISGCNGIKVTKPINVEQQGTKGKTAISEDEGHQLYTNVVLLGNNTERNNRQSHSFYGEWEIKKIAAYGPVSMYDNEDIKRIIGKKISYSANLANGDSVCKKPFYKLSTMTKGDFESLNRVSFTRLGINGDSIIRVVVYTDESHKDIWNSDGSLFYLKDDNTLILYSGGVYFEAVRMR